MKLSEVTILMGQSSILFQLLSDTPAEKAKAKLNIVHFLTIAYRLIWEKWRMTLGSGASQLPE